MRSIAKSAYTLPNLIIAGAAKSGTSSLFKYLNDHPQICGSSKKETLFFFKDLSAESDLGAKHYSKYFRHCSSDHKVRFEASPGYLYDVNAAGRIKQLIPDVKFLFILRNPVRRFISNYFFQVGQQRIPKAVSLSKYVQLCFQNESKRIMPKDLNFEVRHLSALDFGNYAKYLDLYEKEFDHQQIKIMFFDRLESNIHEFMHEICEFIDVEPSIFDHYTFDKVNVTFSAKNELIHRIAMLFNNKAEQIFRQRPEIKKRLVDFYKKMNQKQVGYPEVDQLIIEKLKDYYETDIQMLKHVLKKYNHINLPSWIS